MEAEVQRKVQREFVQTILGSRSAATCDSCAVVQSDLVFRGPAYENSLIPAGSRKFFLYQLCPAFLLHLLFQPGIQPFLRRNALKLYARSSA
jgi:hypothetical protein